MTKPDSDRIRRLTAAISEHEDIDWENEQLSASDADEKRVIRNLAVVAKVAHANRQVFSLSADIPFPTWAHLRLVARVGAGSYGEVFRAWDDNLGQEVALKLFPVTGDRDDPFQHNMRLEEARRLAKIRHQNVVRVLGTDIDHGRVGFWMEYLEGETLEASLEKRGALDAREASDLGIKICVALSAVHAAGVLHRDLKTSNVLRESGGRLCLVDFGAGTSVTDRVPSMQRAGTLLYMAPETLLSGDSSVRSDLYSLGALLFHIVTLRFPVEADTHEGLVAAHREGERLDVSELRPDLPTEFRRVLKRCLDPDPAERYASASQVEEALTNVLASGAQPMLRARRRNVTLSAVLVGALALVGATQLPWQRAWDAVIGSSRTVDEAEGTAPATPQASHWVLVAEFEGPDDPGLAIAAHALVTAGLERSTLVKPIEGPDLQAGLRLAMKPDTTRISEAVARELALRARARAYVSGRIDRILEGYSIVLRAWDPVDNSLLVSVNDVANGDDALVPVLAGLANQLHEGMGAKLSSGTPRALFGKGPLTAISTPSLQACVLLHQARELLWQGDGEASTHMLERALEFDPDFAFAWFLLGVNHWNRGDAEGARRALEEALRRPERLTENQRLMVEADHASIEADYSKAIRTFDLLLERDPFYITAYNDRGATLAALGRYEDALDSYRRGCDLSPFRPIQMTLSNQFVTLLRLGRIEEARHGIENLDGDYRDRAELRLAMVRGSWQLADSLSRRLHDDPSASLESRFVAEIVVASVDAVHGEVEAASRRLEELAEKSPLRSRGAKVPLWRMLLPLMSGDRGKEIPTFACTGDTTLDCLWLNGLRSAFVGDVVSAEGYFEKMTKRPLRERKLHDLDLAYLEAWIAAASHRWEEAARCIRTTTAQGRAPISVQFEAEGRWLVAVAYENLGRMGEAAQEFERLLLPQSGDPIQRGFFCSFARQRLVLLYSRMGRAGDARRHWKILETAFANPDPELMPLVEEARRALEEAEARAPL